MDTKNVGHLKNNATNKQGKMLDNKCGVCNETRISGEQRDKRYVEKLKESNKYDEYKKKKAEAMKKLRANTKEEEKLMPISELGKAISMRRAAGRERSKKYRQKLKQSAKDTQIETNPSCSLTEIVQKSYRCSQTLGKQNLVSVVTKAKPNNQTVTSQPPKEIGNFFERDDISQVSPIARQMFSNVGLLKSHQKIHIKKDHQSPCDLSTNRPEEQPFLSDEISVKSELCSDNESQDVFEGENMLEISKTEYKFEETVVNAVMKPSQFKKKNILIENGNETSNIQYFQDIKEEFLSDSECVDKVKVENKLFTFKDINRLDNTSQGFEANSNIEDSLQLNDNTNENLTKSKVFNCKFCPVTFTSENLWKNHLKEHVGERPFSCSFCKKSFLRKSDLTKHAKHHTGDRPYPCSFCKQTFVQKTDLIDHETLHAGKRPYFCSFCKKTFAQKWGLVIHERLHTGERPYSCSFCKKTFSRIFSLNIHERRHTGERPYSCSICKKTFIRRSVLMTHEQLHTGEIPYSCSFCKKTFKQRSLWSRHEKMHTYERLSCSYCKKKFVDSSTLEVHLMMHTNINKFPYSCSWCKHSFKRKNSLIKHCKSTHNRELSDTKGIPNLANTSRNQCAEENSNSNDSQLSQTELENSQEFQVNSKCHFCKFCLQVFTSATGLKYHLKIHTDKSHFSCSICKKTFSKETSLNNHKKKLHNELVLSCAFCKEIFTENSALINHEKKHNTFSCSYCKKTYKTKKSLKSHERIHTKK